MSKTLRVAFSLMLVLSIPALSWAFVDPGIEGAVDKTSFNVPRVYHPEIQAQLKNRPAWQAFLSEHGRWTVKFNEKTGIPRLAFGEPLTLPGVARIDADNLEQVCGMFLQELSEVIPISVEELRLVYSKEIFGRKWFVTYQQFVDDVPILRGEVKLRLTTDGKLSMFTADVYSDVEVSILPSVSFEEAVGYASVGVSFDRKRDVATGGNLVVLPIENQTGYDFHLAYELNLKTAEPVADWRCYVDAHDGELLWRYNQVYYETILGNVSGDVQLETPFDPWVEKPFWDQYVNVEGYDPAVTDSFGNWEVQVSGGAPRDIEVWLWGRWVNVNRYDGSDAHILTTGSPGTPVDIYWDPSNSQPAERTGFYHTVIAHNYLREIDPNFHGLDYEMPCNVNITSGTCNAYWDGSSINFFKEGGGCTNTAQIADVVYHEYGHGVTQHVHPNCPGDMHEGFSDYYGCTITNQNLVGRGFTGPGSYLRNLKNTLRYPEDMNGQVHHDGMIIGGALWDIREMMYPDVELADSLFHYARYGYAGGFVDYFYDVLEVDDDDGNIWNGTPHARIIYIAFGNNHGIGPGLYVNIVHTPLLDTEDDQNPYPVLAEVTGIFPINVDSVITFYSTGGDFTPLHMTPTGNPDEYGCEIPAQPSGTYVHYYLLGLDSLGTRGLLPENAPDSVFTFYVGPDVIPPSFEMVKAQGNTIDLFGPYGPVVVKVTDVNGIDTNRVELTYQVNEGTPYPPVRMPPTGNPDEFSGMISIPERLNHGDVVKYYITAYDGANNPNQGRFPEEGFFSFEMADFELVDDFEEGIGKWDTGQQWMLLDEGYQSRHSASTSLKENYPNNLNDPMRLLEGYNLTPYEHAWVSFRGKHIIVDEDYCAVEVTSDGGNTSTEIGRITGASLWAEYAFPFDQFTGPGYDDVALIFRMVSNDEGNSTGIYVDDVTVHTTSFTGVGGQLASASTPSSFKLHQNFPNPFNPATMIQYDLPQPGRVKVEVFNILGQRVKTLVDEFQQAGYRSALWDGRNAAGGEVASGVYFYRIAAGDFNSVKRMTLVR